MKNIKGKIIASNEIFDFDMEMLSGKLCNITIYIICSPIRRNIVSITEGV